MLKKKRRASTWRSRSAAIHQDRMAGPVVMCVNSADEWATTIYVYIRRAPKCGHNNLKGVLLLTADKKEKKNISFFDWPVFIYLKAIIYRIPKIN